MIRRHFLKRALHVSLSAGAGGLTSIFATRHPPAFAQGTTIVVLQPRAWAPATDQLWKQQVADAGKALGVRTQLELLDANDIRLRATAAVQAQSGADVVSLREGEIDAFSRELTDVSEVCAWKIKNQGTFYEVASASANIRGRWFAVPYDLLGRQVAFRRSVLQSLGVAEFPKTWERFRDVGRAAKKKSQPFGQAMSHDASKSKAWVYPFLWSWGSGEFERQGRRPQLDSKETVESIRIMQTLWKDAFDEGGLAWDDSGNRRAFYSDSLVATVDLPSIYLNAMAPEKVRDDTEFAALPAGPGGQFAQYSVTAHAILKTSKAPKVAADLITWIHASERFSQVLASENGYRVGPNASWGSEQRLKGLPARTRIFQALAERGQTFGYPGAATASSLKLASLNVIVDMYTKSILGMRPEDAAKWAQSELARAYEGVCAKEGECQCKDGTCLADCCPRR